MEGMNRFRVTMADGTTKDFTGYSYQMSEGFCHFIRKLDEQQAVFIGCVAASQIVTIEDLGEVGPEEAKKQ